MSTDPETGIDSQEQRRDPAAWRAPFSPAFWMQVALGLALAGYGLWTMSQRGWKSPFGFLVLCVGVMILPLWVARVLGGLGAMGLAVFLIANAGGTFDYLYGALILFVGVSAAMDGVREFRAKRRR